MKNIEHDILESESESESATYKFLFVQSLKLADQVINSSLQFQDGSSRLLVTQKNQVLEFKQPNRFILDIVLSKMICYFGTWNVALVTGQ